MDDLLKEAEELAKLLKSADSAKKHGRHGTYQKKLEAARWAAFDIGWAIYAERFGGLYVRSAAR